MNKDERFSYYLIHPNIELHKDHNKKEIKDIAIEIDKEIKKKYSAIDLQIQTDKNNVKIESYIKDACQLLIQKWFKAHKDKIDLFEFTKSHLVDISVKILFDEETKKILEDFLINTPEDLIDILKFNDPSAPFFFDDSSISFNEDDDSSISSSFDATNNTTLNQVQPNFNFVINNNNNNNYYYYNYRRRRNHNRGYYNNNNNNNNNYNNYYLELLRIRYEEGLKKYLLAQAYVYEKLKDSNKFSEVVWKNKVNENEEGIEVTLANNHKYWVRKVEATFDLIVKTHQNS